MAAENKPEYKGFQQGDIAVRKGRLCVISKINWTTSPPDVTVKMQDTGDEVGTEFSRLCRPTDEDMLKFPMNQKENSPILSHSKPHDASASTTTNPRKRSFFDAFFKERKQKFTKSSVTQPTSSTNNHNTHTTVSHTRSCDDMPQINANYSDKRTFEDLLFEEPSHKRRKLNSNSKNVAQGWHCSACTVENQDMDTLKCYLCDTPRTYEEKIKYPTISPVTQNNNSKEQKDNDQSSLTYITWNVWFQEEIQVIERMKAIGNIIDKHKADIVCFQEITPLILDILQNGDWYRNNGYSSTILPSHGAFEGLRYFNVIMTRHEFVRDAIQFKYFKNTQMGRHLIVTPIQLKTNDKRIVYAATSHLESPVGTWAGGRKDKFSPQRKEQLAHSLQVLDDDKICSNKNVIFGGDFNWCRPTKNAENDGDLNKLLHGPWTDCWHALHPNDKGYTYDAKANGMLSGYLQNRLDRIVYKKNGDLRLKSCQMIGREAIPNITYVKTFKRKKGNEDKILPVFPSDHFGLVAQFDII
eukprot:474826_1